MPGPRKRIRSGLAPVNSWRTPVRLKSPPRTIVINTAADPRRTFKANPRRIRGLADTTPRRTLVRQKWRTPTFFHDQKVRRSAAYLSRIRSGSAADFWVRGGLRRSPQRIHFSPRKLSTWRIRHRSATGPPKSASDPRRYRSGLESAHLIARLWENSDVKSDKKNRR